MKAIYGFIVQEDSRTNEDKIQCTDNCISAIGKHILYHFDGQLITIASVKELLLFLPLYSDGEEAQAFHKLFFEEILQKNEVLMIPEIQSDVRVTVQRIINIAQKSPELEILNDEGKELAQKIVEGQ